MDAVPLETYRLTVVRHRMALLACLLTGLLAAGLQVQLTGAEYTATTTVTLRPRPAPGTEPPEGLDLALSVDTEAQILRSRQVGEAAARVLGGTQRSVTRSITLRVPPGTRTLHITYRARTAGRALAGTRAVTDAYLAQRKDQNDARRDALIRDRTLDIAAANEQRRAAREVATDPKRPQASRDTAGRLVSQLVQHVAREQRRVDRLQALDTSAGTVTKRPQHARGPRVADRAVPLASGLALGLLAWVCAVPVLTRTRRVTSEADAALPGVRHVATLPLVTGVDAHTGGPRPGPEQLAWWGRVMAAVPELPRVVAVLPTEADTGVAAAARLAATLATTSGARIGATALVTLGPPPWALLQAAAAETAGPPPAAGPVLRAVTYLEGPSAPGVTLAVVEHPLSELTRAALVEALDLLGSRFPHVVVLGPAPGEAGRRALTALADVPVVVARPGRTRVSALRECTTAVRQAPGRPVWTVLATDPGEDRP